MKWMVINGNYEINYMGRNVMMKYVIGVDLGTSAVKLLLVNQSGKVVQEVSKPYPLIQEKTGYSEQDPQVWVDQTAAGLSELLTDYSGDLADIEGISFSGQIDRKSVV